MKINKERYKYHPPNPDRLYLLVSNNAIAIAIAIAVTTGTATHPEHVRPIWCVNCRFEHSCSVFFNHHWSWRVCSRILCCCCCGPVSICTVDVHASYRRRWSGWRRRRMMMMWFCCSCVIVRVECRSRNVRGPQAGQRNDTGMAQVESSLCRCCSQVHVHVCKELVPFRHARRECATFFTNIVNDFTLKFIFELISCSTSSTEKKKGCKKAAPPKNPRQLRYT